jgi:hypothetical protein
MDNEPKTEERAYPLSSRTLPKSQRLLYALASAGLLIAGVIILFAFSVNNNANTQKSLIEQEVQKTNQIASDNNKLSRVIQKLSEENKQLNQTTLNYAYCNAVLVAQYTQTLQPITIVNLNDCVLKNLSDTAAQGVIKGTTVPSSSKSPASSSNPTPNSSTTKPSSAPTSSSPAPTSSTAPMTVITTPQPVVSPITVNPQLTGSPSVWLQAPAPVGCINVLGAVTANCK